MANIKFTLVLPEAHQRETVSLSREDGEMRTECLLMCSKRQRTVSTGTAHESQRPNADRRCGLQWRGLWGAALACFRISDSRVYLILVNNSPQICGGRTAGPVGSIQWVSRAQAVGFCLFSLLTTYTQRIILGGKCYCFTSCASHNWCRLLL